MAGMTIRAAARAAGVGVQTIRYYERAGLIVQPPRPSSGYHQYSPGAVHRVRFIKRAQRLGFTLAEIEELLALQFGDHLTCEDVTRRAAAKGHEVEERIAALASL